MAIDILINAIKLHDNLSPLQFSGNFYYTIDYLRALVNKDKYNICILADQFTYDYIYKFASENQIIGVELNTKNKFTEVLSANKYVYETISLINPRLYHRPSGQLPFKRLNCKTLATIHDLNFKHLKTNMVLKFYKELSYLYTMKRADKIVAISEYTKNELINNYDHSSKINIIRNPLRTFKDTNLNRDSLLKLNNLGSNFLISFAQHRHKNPILTIDIFSKAVEKYPDAAKLVLIGDNDYLNDEVKKYAKSKPTNSQVVFWGQAKDEELVWLFKHASLMMYLSSYEGFGMPVIEALSFGCPVLSSDVGPLLEINNPGLFQLTLSNKNDIVNLLINLLLDDNTREKVNSRSIIDRYSTNKFIDQYIAVIDNILN